MNLIKNKWLFILACVSILSSIQIYADETIPSRTIQNEEVSPLIPFKKITDEKSNFCERRPSVKEELNFWRAKQVLNESEMANEEQILPLEEEICSKESYYTAAFHYQSNIPLDGSIINFADGPQWNVHPGYWNRVFNYWRPNDLIFIRPNSLNWLSSYHYILCNQSNGDVVEADLIGAFDNLYIMNIDWLNGVIQLNDGSYWRLNDGDFGIYGNWYPGDPVVIGINSPGRSFFYKYIIIKVTNGFYVESN